MDIMSILIITGILLLCLVPVIFRAFRSYDKAADDLEDRDPESAKAIGAARRKMERGRGICGP